MRLVVMAYHNVGYLCLEYLIKRKENIVAVVTHKDDPEEIIWFKNVEELARKHKIPVYTPRSVNSKEFLQILKELKPDVIFSFMFRKLFKAELLKIPKYGCINLHPSLLPKYRGRCPLNWVLINGEETSGVTLHYMEVKADSGNIIGQKKVKITPQDNIIMLHNKITMASLSLFKEVFPKIKKNRLKRLPQVASESSYFQGRGPKDGRIDWNKSASEINNFIRALTYPFPGAFAFYKDKKIILWEAFVQKEYTKNKKALKSFKKGQIVDVDNKKIKIFTKKGILVVKRLQIDDKNEERFESPKKVLNKYKISIKAQLK